MKDEPVPLAPGARIRHPELGEGVLIQTSGAGLVRAFFGTGERTVPLSSLSALASWDERLLAAVAGDRDRQERAWLHWEAHALPSSESGAALTAARVDLLPHQVVLTHRIASASPRRFLVADEVGLGKTIETALVLRELASRGELRRALMVVPAGLLNNWHRELNEVFHLDFEVFGAEGDVTDRKSNAFERHDRLIASLDTLKRPARIRRILEARPWDLIVFDEAHHLSAYRSGGRAKRTDNYRLAEALRAHTRDLLLLSATPHQGDHFRFWMLIQLLKPTLFRDPDDMVENRHRLNEVVFRRTKADACRADGSPLFARRWVHTEAFGMQPQEREFYEELRTYLEEGFAAARAQGSRGRAIGFLMAIFQKIAASSFAAVHRTLRRRLIALTVHAAVLRDRALDIDGREALLDEARAAIREEHGVPAGRLGDGEVDRLLAEVKLRILRRLEEGADSHADTEPDAVGSEQAAADILEVALPQERERLRLLIARAPQGTESKVQKLLAALSALWSKDPDEKIVIFATYLGTVDLLAAELERSFPAKGVVVLRGGDHGAKIVAERRFRASEGPRVLICTAAGREGINLQFARILFNFDLPWNPMDLEQRIGRIHRYGQRHTAQVYNLLLADTIEGRIYLLLEEKLHEIARALGKIDESGQVAEDLRSQILGQLSERLSYEQLYQSALADPQLRRTRLEVDAALTNATEARTAVRELFQDLERFTLEDYRPMADSAAARSRLERFFMRGATLEGQSTARLASGVLEWRDSQGSALGRFTLDRDRAMAYEELDLLGLDHPAVKGLLDRCRQTMPEGLGIAVSPPGAEPAVLTLWSVEMVGPGQTHKALTRPIAVSLEGARRPLLERDIERLLLSPPSTPGLSLEDRRSLLHRHVEPVLQREIRQGFGEAAYAARLIGWIEIVPT